MKVAAFIPARWGSTRLEGKPLARIGSRPMVQWVYERASSAELIDEVAVATDDERIFKAIKGFGGNVVMTSVDHASGTERVAEAAASSKAEIIVNLQGDEPLIEPHLIDEAIRPMLDDPDILICTLKTRIHDEEEYLNPNAVKVVTDKDGFALFFSRSPLPHMRKGFYGHGAGQAAYKHIGLYVYRKEALLKLAKLEQTGLEKAESLEQLRFLENGYRIKVVEVSYNPVSVDTPEDLEKVRGLLK